MKNRSIRELLDSFISNYVPMQVRMSFASWLTGREEAAEKEQALEEMWDEMSLEKERFEFDDILPDFDSVLADAREAENPVSVRKYRRYRLMSRIWGAVACAAVIFSITVYLSRGSETTVLTASSSKAYYELPDGSSVWLNRDSRLSYRNDLGGKRRELSLVGEAFFDVAKDAEHPFVVSTPNMDVKVLGTRFTLSAYADSPECVYLESGKVSLYSPHFAGEVLAPGESFSYNPLTGAASRRHDKVVNHLSWTGSQLVFANAALSDIVSNLEHWYNVKIELAGKCSGERLSLVVREEPLQEILEAICRITGASYSINGNEISIN